MLSYQGIAKADLWNTLAPNKCHNICDGVELEGEARKGDAVVRCGWRCRNGIGGGHEGGGYSEVWGGRLCGRSCVEAYHPTSTSTNPGAPPLQPPKSAGIASLLSWRKTEAPVQGCFASFFSGGMFSLLLSAVCRLLIQPHYLVCTCIHCFKKGGSKCNHIGQKVYF